MDEELYTIKIFGNGVVTLTDVARGQVIHAWKGATALVAAVAKLTELEADHDGAPSVVVDGDGDEWTYQGNGLYCLYGDSADFGRTVDGIRDGYGIREMR